MAPGRVLHFLVAVTTLLSLASSALTGVGASGSPKSADDPGIGDKAKYTGAKDATTGNSLQGYPIHKLLVKMKLNPPDELPQVTLTDEQIAARPLPAPTFGANGGCLTNEAIMEALKDVHSMLSGEGGSVSKDGKLSPMFVTRLVYSEPLLLLLSSMHPSTYDQKDLVDRNTSVPLSTFVDNLNNLLEGGCITGEKLVKFEKANFDDSSVSSGLVSINLPNPLTKSDTDAGSELLRDILDAIDDTKAWKLFDRVNDLQLNGTQRAYIDSMANEAHSKKLHRLYEHVVTSWGSLTRKKNSDIKCNITGSDGSCVTTLLDTKDYSFVVPGGRFREPYLWDSYTISRALLSAGHIDTLQDILGLFSDWIYQYGRIPNGGRTYYLLRSQPPLFTLMVDAYLSSMRGNDNDSLMRRYSAYIKFLPAVLYEREQYWDRMQFSSIPIDQCRARLKDVVKRIYSYNVKISSAVGSNNRSGSANSQPQVVVDAMVEKLVESYFDKSNTVLETPPGKGLSLGNLMCSGYHYGSDIPGIDDIESLASLKSKLSHSFPRIESYIHDLKIAQSVAENISTTRPTLSKVLSALGASESMSTSLVSSWVLLAMASFAESGWDFSTRWTHYNTEAKSHIPSDYESDSINVHQGPARMADNDLHSEDVISSFPDQDEILKNAILSRIYPIDLNSILLRNMQLAHNFLTDFANIHEKYISNPIAFTDGPGSKPVHSSSTTRKADELYKTASKEKGRIKIRMQSLKNFISLFLWDEKGKHFCDHVEGYGCTSARTAAEFFPYWLRMHDIVSKEIADAVKKMISNGPGYSLDSSSQALLSLGSRQPDFFLYEIGCSDYFASFANIVKELTVMGDSSGLEEPPYLPILPTKLHSGLQWDAPVSWAPLEYAVASSYPSLAMARDNICIPIYKSITKGGKNAPTDNASSFAKGVPSILSNFFYGSAVTGQDLTPVSPSHLSDGFSSSGGKHLMMDSSGGSYEDNTAADPLRIGMTLRMIGYISHVAATIPDEVPEGGSPKPVAIYEKYDTSADFKVWATPGKSTAEKDATAANPEFGEYTTQIGFGWTNAVLQEFMRVVYEGLDNMASVGDTL